MKFAKISAAAVGLVAMPVELWIDRLPPGTGHRCAFRWITKDYEEALAKIIKFNPSVGIWNIRSFSDFAKDAAELYGALEFYDCDRSFIQRQNGIR